MYDKIGGKIKGLAKAMFIVVTIPAVIVGIAILAIYEELMLYGLLILILGPIIAWVSSFALYGFGELIEKVCEIATNTRTSQNVSNVDKNIERIENCKKITSNFKTDGIMNIPKRNK